MGAARERRTAGGGAGRGRGGGGTAGRDDAGRGCEKIRDRRYLVAEGAARIRALRRHTSHLGALHVPEPTPAACSATPPEAITSACTQRPASAPRASAGAPASLMVVGAVHHLRIFRLAVGKPSKE